MSAPSIILASLPSFCQILSQFDEVLTKTNMHSFFETQCTHSECDSHIKTQKVGFRELTDEILNNVIGISAVTLRTSNM